MPFQISGLVGLIIACRGYYENIFFYKKTL